MVVVGEAGVLVVLHLRPQVAHAADCAGARDVTTRLARGAAAVHCAPLAWPLLSVLLSALRSATSPYTKARFPPKLKYVVYFCLAYE